MDELHAQVQSLQQTVSDLSERVAELENPGLKLQHEPYTDEDIDRVNAIADRITEIIKNDTPVKRNAAARPSEPSVQNLLKFVPTLELSTLFNDGTIFGQKITEKQIKEELSRRLHAAEKSGGQE